MRSFSKILSDSIEGDPSAADQLLPLVYEELRRLASAKMAAQPAGHSLQATALVHEAYLRLVELEPDRSWEGRRHFLAAAAEAMRRILIDRARRKQREKHGGNMARQRYAEDAVTVPATDDIKGELLDVDSALCKLQSEKPRMAELVKLRFYVGMPLSETAEVLGISPSTADRDWAYARAWLIRQIGAGRHGNE